MKKNILFLTLLVTNISLVFAADTLRIGDLYYKIYTSSVYAEVIAEPGEEEPRYNSLTEVEIPSSVTCQGTEYPVTTINQYAFRNCTSLVKITIPTSISSIGSAVFNKCTSLTTAGFTMFGAQNYYEH